MTTDPLTVPPPTARSLVKTTVIAAVVATLILVTTVLPAEYGVDPLGTGRLLGLTALSSPPVMPVELPVTAGAPLAPVVSGPAAVYPASYKVDSVELTIDPYEYLEYKYQLEKGAHMLYSWSASAPVMHDFHGEVVGGAEPTEQSFDNADRREGRGALVAPFTGIHGWFWENPGGTPVTIKLQTAGFYSSAIEIRSDRTRKTHQVSDPPGVTK